MEIRSLALIAADIKRGWPNMNYAAKPYYEAMYSLDKITDQFYQDSGTSIVRYFLSNATTWKGDVARHIKAELKDMLKNV